MNYQKKLNVIFLPAWYPSQFNKIGGVFVKEHAKSINNDVNLAVFHVCAHPYLRRFCFFEEVKEDDILTYRIYYRKFSKKWLTPISFLLFFTSAIIGYRKVRNRFKPDIHHVHILTRMGVLALMIKWWYKTPYVITEHWSRYLPERNTYKGSLRKWLTKLVVKKSAGISAVSRGLKSALLKHNLYHENFPVISNVVDTDLFTYNFFKGKNFTFLHVSGLNDNVKNISGLLRSFKKLIEKEQDVKLILVGDDVLERPILEKYAMDLGLVEYVCFVGKKYGLDLVDYYQKADVFVMFSNFENQPCVILEAMSSGLPVVSSNVGGISEVVNNEIGILVNAGNEIELTDAMKVVKNNVMNFDAGKIRKYAVESYSYKSVSISILNFYEKAIA